MATKDQTDQPTKPVIVPPPPSSPPPQAEPDPVVLAPLVSFDRWFRATGRPPHHKKGMQAYARTAGTQTVAQWDSIFASY